MSRKQDQRLVEAYERVVKGEPPMLDEKKGLGVHITKNPKGTFSFKGTIPVELGWVNKDGSELNPEQAKEVARANNPAMIAKARVFKTSKEAVKAAKKYKTGVTSVDEAKEFTKSRGKWFTTRLKDMKGSVKDLEGAIKKQSPNDIAASLSGIDSQLTVMKQAIGKVSEEELNEMGMVIGTPLSRRKDATPTLQIDEAKWSKDPFGYKRELTSRLKDVAGFVAGIHVSDRYYSGIDHDKKLKARVDKVFTALTKAVDNLEKVVDKNKGI